MSYTLVSDELIEKLTDEDERKHWLVLNRHSEFEGRWIVEGFDPHFFYDLHEIIGPYRQVSPASLERFTELATGLDYKIAFFEDPGDLLQRFKHLRDLPPFEVNSQLPGTIHGLLPFQLEGFNYLKDSHAGLLRYSTGTGKTVVAGSLLRYHTDLEDYDVAWFVVKAHNKINTQRAIKSMFDLDSVVVAGTPAQRQRVYDKIAEKPTIAIVNYEKFRDDTEAIIELHQDTRITCIWDEMPSKLSNRSSKLYKGVVSCLYTTKPPAVHWDRKRPSSLRQYALSATPIEKDPEGFFNICRLLDPRIYGTVKEFRDEFVAGYSFFDQNKPEDWHKLDKIGLKAEHIIHQADKEKDPNIAKMFPKLIEEPYIIDWDEKDRRLYDAAVNKAEGLLEDTNVLSMIQVLQMLCDAPSMLNHSAATRESYEAALEAFTDFGDVWAKEPTVRGSEAALAIVQALGPLTDDRHTKIKTLKSLILDAHPDEKIIVFSAFNNLLLPSMESWLQDWGVRYVRYDGSIKAKQEAEDSFRTDLGVQVFLSSDQGADSLNLPEASVVIDYDLPWKYTTKKQRNRHHRVTTLHKTVRRYTLQMANSVEERKAQIIGRKQGYHEGIFDGAVADSVVSSRMTREDLYYIFGS